MEESARARYADPSTQAFAAAAERFSRLLQATIAAQRGSPDVAQAMRALQASLASDLEAWLRLFHPTAGAASWLGSDLLGSHHLVAECIRLQGEMAGFWNRIAGSAGEKLAARVAAAAPGAPLSDLHKLYDTWIDCAEEAYAETVHSPEFCRVLAEWINTITALRSQGAQLAESWSRSMNLPTRSEFDALKRELEELRAQATAHAAARGRRRTGPQRRRQGRR